MRERKGLGRYLIAWERLTKEKDQPRREEISIKNGRATENDQGDELKRDGSWRGG